MKKSFSLLLLILAASLAQGQNKAGYSVSVSVSGLRDTTLYLAHHFGDKQYLSDSVFLDSRGAGIFSGTESLPHGIYMIVLPGRKYFEILISDDQVFSVTCTYKDFYNTMAFKGSEENTYFIDYQRKWVAMQQESASIARRLQANKQNSDSLKLLGAKQKAIEASKTAYLHKVIDDNQGNLLAMLVRSMLPVEVPEFEVPANIHNADSVKWVKKYNYNKDHFFDNLDLTDERLLRTPILQARLEAFFTNVVLQSPDSLNPQVSKILKMCEPDHTMYQYISAYLFNHFRESEIMGHDGVLLKIADEVYLSGKADWVTEEFKDKLRKDVELLRFNQLGMKGQDLVMDSFRGIFVSLHDIEKDYTILYFWEPNCGHCKEATPKLKEYYNKPKDYSLEVFAVCTISDKKLWSNYIEENGLTWINGWDPDRTTHYDYYYNVQSTPIVYILDRNKKIIAKKIAVEDIEGFLENYRKFFR